MPVCKPSWLTFDVSAVRGNGELFRLRAQTTLATDIDQRACPQWFDQSRLEGCFSSNGIVLSMHLCRRPVGEYPCRLLRQAGRSPMTRPVSENGNLTNLAMQPNFQMGIDQPSCPMRLDQSHSGRYLYNTAVVFPWHSKPYHTRERSQRHPPERKRAHIRV